MKIYALDDIARFDPNMILQAIRIISGKDSKIVIHCQQFQKVPGDIASGLAEMGRQYGLMGAQYSDELNELNLQKFNDGEINTILTTNWTLTNYEFDKIDIVVICRQYPKFGLLQEAIRDAKIVAITQGNIEKWDLMS